MYVRVKKYDELHLGWDDSVQLYLCAADRAAAAAF